MPSELKGINHGTKEINLSKHSSDNPSEYRPIEIHLKENGAIGDKPSLCIVLENPFENIGIVYGQFSVKTFNEGLAEIGYEIKKIDET